MLPAVNPITNMVYVVSNFGYVTVIDGKTNTVLNTMAITTTATGIGDIAINTAINRIYVSDSDNNKVAMINGITNDTLKTIQVGKSPIGISANPDNDHVYVANSGDDTVSVISSSIPISTSPPTALSNETVTSSMNNTTTANEFTNWYNKGVDLLNAGKYTEALTAFNNAISINPESCSYLA